MARSPRIPPSTIRFENGYSDDSVFKSQYFTPIPHGSQLVLEKIRKGYKKEMR